MIERFIRCARCERPLRRSESRRGSTWGMRVLAPFGESQHPKHVQTPRVLGPVSWSCSVENSQLAFSLKRPRIGFLLRLLSETQGRGSESTCAATHVSLLTTRTDSHHSLD